jgi:S-adenosylmethionine/arginine decarboxylase-like enzyme
MHGVEYEYANSTEELDKLITRIATQLNFVILHRHFHSFSPQGVTGFLLLAESHIAVHSWPELRYVHITLASCKDTDESVQQVITTVIEPVAEQVKTIVVETMIESKHGFSTP